MNPNVSYVQLTWTNPDDAASSLEKWCKENGQLGGIMLFDEINLQSIKDSISEQPQNEKPLAGIPLQSLPSQVKQMQVGDLVIYWETCWGDGKSILKRVLKQSTKTILYESPKAFWGTSISFGL